MMIHNDVHMIQVPKAFWGIKIAQLVIAVLTFAIGCFYAAVFGGAGGYTLFTTLFTIGILIYYFVAVHNAPKAYNWIALLVLECVAVVFWLVLWALTATVLGYAANYYNTYFNNSYYKRDNLSKRWTVGELQAVGACAYVLLALGLIEWVLYIATLVMFGMGVHQHRKAGRPMDANGNTSSFNMASQAEKHNMQPMPANQTYYTPDQQQQGQHQFQPQQPYPNEAPSN